MAKFRKKSAQWSWRTCDNKKMFTDTRTDRRTSEKAPSDQKKTLLEEDLISVFAKFYQSIRTVQELRQFFFFFLFFFY